LCADYTTITVDINTAQDGVSAAQFVSQNTIIEAGMKAGSEITQPADSGTSKIAGSGQ
jgi:hypothetical protein